MPEKRMKNSGGSLFGSNFQEEHAIALVVLISLALLIMIRMGFRGVGLPFTQGSVRVGV